MRNYQLQAGKDTLRMMRGEFHRHTEISGDGRNDGPLIDAYRYMIDAAYMDWVGCCDHDNGGGHEYFWWLNQKLTDAYHLGNRFVPMFAYERSVQYPEGHRNVVFPTRGIRPLPQAAEDGCRFAAHACARHPDAVQVPAGSSEALWRRTRRAPIWGPTGATTTRWSSRWSRSTRATVRITRCRMRRGRIARRIRSAAGVRWASCRWRLQKGYKLAFRSLERSRLDAHVVLQSVGHLADSRRHHGGVPQAPRLRRDRQYSGGRPLRRAHDGRGVYRDCGAFDFGKADRAPRPFAKVHIIKDSNYVYAIEPKTRQVELHLAG